MFHPIGASSRFLSLIIVLESLRKKVIFAYRASGVGAHMGKFKTLLTIRSRFFWSRMRKDIMIWVTGCSGCIPARVKRRESSGLVHSWPITTPFAIISVDIWKPGHTTNLDGYTCLLNTMCDMAQFMITMPAMRTESSYIARLFMEGVLLKFGLCLMVVIDEGSEFRGLFEKMCNLLNIRFHQVAKRNHKAVGVERFHKFLNHAQTISTEERGTAAAFVECGLATAYAWNASPIDGTDIIRSIPAIGRCLRFPLEVHESTNVAPIDNATCSDIEYIRYLGQDVEFARKLIAWTSEDRREQHRERVNNDREIIQYKQGDIVMGRIAVQSKSETGTVQKLVYQIRGPFVIVGDTGHSSYLVQRYGNPNSALQKFMTEDLYLLPPQILPCEHMDTPDMRYLNADFAPLQHPFGKVFDIEAYNNAWFDDKPPSRPPEFIRDSSIPDILIHSAKPLSSVYPSSSETTTTDTTIDNRMTTQTNVPTEIDKVDDRHVNEPNMIYDSEN